MGMQIKDISDKAFSAYGKVITGLDVTGILKEMEHTPLPDDVIYVPSVTAMFISEFLWYSTAFNFVL